MTDTLHRFLFKNAPVKGELLHLPNTWHNMREHQHYPAPVEKILGELVAASALLSANLKFDGSLIMQVHGDGPLQLLVAECRSDLTVRATAKIRDSVILTDNTTLKELVNINGNGKFAITLDPNHRQEGQQPYQSIVPLVGETMAEVLEHYMANSEQLDTKIQLAANEHNAAGFLLQRLPNHGGGLNVDFSHSWQDLLSIAHTLSNDELLNTDIETLMHRLFWEHQIETHTEETVKFSCSCSTSKVHNMLVMLGKEEAFSMIDENNKVNVHCDFCGQNYTINSTTVDLLFDSNTNESQNVLH